MKKILLITHGDLCKGYLSAVDTIIGDSSSVDTLIVSDKETLETMTNQVNNYIQSCDSNDIVIICTDIAVGTTTKCAIPAMVQSSCYLITGINLSLLLGIILSNLGQHPENTLKEMIKEAQQAIMFLNEEF